MRDSFLLPSPVLVGALVACVCATSGCLSHKTGSQSSHPVGPSELKYQPGESDADAPEEFTITKSGLKYRILRRSDGRKPTAEDTVTCHYKGWLDDKTVFDQSYVNNNGEPISFALSGVIPGWTEGVQLVGVGGMIELEIPFEIGYGVEGSPPQIPPRARLHFIVELVSID